MNVNAKPIVADVGIPDSRGHQRKNQSMPLEAALPCVRSEDLFGVEREIMIEHLGAYYRLRMTRANKLILTK